MGMISSNFVACQVAIIVARFRFSKLIQILADRVTFLNMPYQKQGSVNRFGYTIFLKSCQKFDRFEWVQLAVDVSCLKPLIGLKWLSNSDSHIYIHFDVGLEHQTETELSVSEWALRNWIVVAFTCGWLCTIQIIVLLFAILPCTWVSLLPTFIITMFKFSFYVNWFMLAVAAVTLCCEVSIAIHCQRYTQVKLQSQQTWFAHLEMFLSNVVGELRLSRLWKHNFPDLQIERLRCELTFIDRLWKWIQVTCNKWEPMWQFNPNTITKVSCITFENCYPKEYLCPMLLANQSFCKIMQTWCASSYHFLTVRDC